MSKQDRADYRILEFFRSGSYGDQGREHINILSDAFLDDLVNQNKTVRSAASSGELVYERNANTASHLFSGDVDLAVGSPTSSEKSNQTQLPTETPKIREEAVGDIWLALDVESLISSIRNNWKNRCEDIYVYYLSVYDEHNLAVTGGIILFNVEDLEGDGDDIIDGLKEFDFADGSIAQTLDSLAVIPFEYDESTPQQTELADRIVPPNHPLSYENFIQVMADSLARRLDGEFKVSAETLDSVLAETETEVLEFKEELDDVSDIAKEAVAFANYDGGSILIGVDDDDGTVVGLDDIDTVEERVNGILKNVEPAIIRNIEKATYENKDLLIVNVARATAVPASYNGTFYVRQGTSKNRMTGREVIKRFPRE